MTGDEPAAAQFTPGKLNVNTNRLLVAIICFIGLSRESFALPPSADESAMAIAALREYLAQPAADRGSLADKPFTSAALTRADALLAEDLLWQDRLSRIRAERATEMNDRIITVGELSMKFHYEVFGEKPASGRSLYISLHGGGGAPAAVNDGQWENQKRLYRPEEGVYLAPRAPTNTWDLWHQAHIDGMFSRIIENMVAFEDVDPDRVYLMGYSAGGDGVYQLAPRMADRLAAASMMAGHPNEASPLGLRNLPFSIHVGGEDAAYNRNGVAKDWAARLDALREADPDGYEHFAKIYEGKGHWLDREDAAAVPWMAKFTRTAWPAKVVWRQDDVVHDRFYWLAADEDQRRAGAEVVAAWQGQRVTIQTASVERITVLLSDRLVDLDTPVEVAVRERIVFNAIVPRTIGKLAATLEARGDPRGTASGEVRVPITAP